jgi:hypothetical protein
MEIHCVDGTGFDANKLCLKPDRFGAELAFRVNEKTEKVLITVVKDDGTWGIKDLFLEHCSVVDMTNWKCTDSELMEWLRDDGTKPPCPRLIWVNTKPDFAT